jgi:hypothetical protein
VLPGAAVESAGQHVVIMESPALATALAWLSARYRIVDATLVLAALGAVLGTVTGRDRAIMMTMSSNRLGSRTRDLVACHAQYTVVHLDLRGDPSFAELVDRAGTAVITAYRYGHYDFAQMKALERDVAERRGVVFSQPAGVNFKRYTDQMRTSPGPTPQLSTVDTKVEVLPTGGSCARGVVLLSVRPGEDATGLELLCDGEAMAPDDMTGLVRAMETWVLAGMADPDLRLSALPELCDVHPPALGPDWALVDDCWVHLPDVALALRDCPGVTAAGAFVRDGSLVAYLTTSGDEPTPDDLRSHALRAAAAGQAVIAPHRYVVCRTAPADERDLAGWEHIDPFAYLP